MKNKIVYVFKLALIMCFFIPSIVFANENKYTVENFMDDAYDYGPLSKPGDFSKFYFEDIDDNIFYEYNWDGEFTEYSGETSMLDFYDPLTVEYGQYYEAPTIQSFGTLLIEESDITPELYYYYVEDDYEVAYKSGDIYSSSSKGSPIGSISNMNIDDYNNSKVYELAKISGGFDYVTEGGVIVLSTDDKGYKIVGNAGSRVTLFNGITAYLIDYNSSSTTTHKTISATTIKELLSKEDLTGLELEFEFSIGTAEYYSITLDNHTYFINGDFDEIIYDSGIIACDDIDYYAVEYKGEYYFFLDFNDYYEDLTPYLKLENQNSYTIHTEVFDLDGDTLFGDTNWLNLYYADYGVMYGITKDDDKYIMKFLTIDGEIIHTEDYTNLCANINPYIVYGSTYFADHDTNSIETGKYIIGYYYYDNEDNYYRKLKFLNVNEYYVIEGKNQTYSGKDLVIRFSGNLEDFENLLINDKIVNTDNYTKESGSVIVTIKADYLKSLKTGTYTIKALFDGGGYASTSVNIPVNNPKTGDSIINSLILGIVSLISLIGTKFYIKTKKYN